MIGRGFIALICAIAVAWPLAAGAQARPPVIGMLHQGPTPPAQLMTAFRDGLREGGLAEAATIAIDDRAANGEYARLPALAADLASRHVAVIATDFLPAGVAAKAATQTIPVVFLTGSDPVASGLVPSLNRPGGNVTGIAFMFTRLGAKNLELLRELLPKARVVGVLVNPSNPNAEPQLKAVLSGSTLAASMLAPTSPSPNNTRAYEPASGSSARAASSALLTWIPAT